MATLKDLQGLRDNDDLLDRVEAACWIVAEEINAENAATVNHDKRVAWAKSAASNSRQEAYRMLTIMLAKHKDASVDQIKGAADNALIAAVRQAVNLFI